MTSAIKHIVKMFLLAKPCTLSISLGLTQPAAMAVAVVVAALLPFVLGVLIPCTLSTVGVGEAVAVEEEEAVAE